MACGQLYLCTHRGQKWYFRRDSESHQTLLEYTPSTYARVRELRDIEEVNRPAFGPRMPLAITGAAPWQRKPWNIFQYALGITGPLYECGMGANRYLFTTNRAALGLNDWILLYSVECTLDVHLCELDDVREVNAPEFDSMHGAMHKYLHNVTVV